MFIVRLTTVQVPKATLETCYNIIIPTNNYLLQYTVHTYILAHY